MSVFKRKGSPYYRYDFLFEGRRYQGSTRLTNRIAAQRAEDVLRGRLAERRAGIVEAKPVPVFKDFAPRFLEMVKPEIRPNTHRSYSISVRNLKPWFDSQRLDEITADAIRQFEESRLKKGRAAPVHQSFRVSDLIPSIYKSLRRCPRTEVGSNWVQNFRHPLHGTPLRIGNCVGVHG